MTTLTEPISYDGGDTRTQCDAYFDLPQKDQDAVIDFLKSLVVVS